MFNYTDLGDRSSTDFGLSDVPLDPCDWFIVCLRVNFA